MYRNIIKISDSSKLIKSYTNAIHTYQQCTRSYYSSTKDQLNYNLFKRHFLQTKVLGSQKIMQNDDRSNLITYIHGMKYPNIKLISILNGEERAFKEVGIPLIPFLISYILTIPHGSPEEIYKFLNFFNGVKYSHYWEWISSEFISTLSDHIFIKPNSILYYQNLTFIAKYGSRFKYLSKQVQNFYNSKAHSLKTEHLIQYGYLLATGHHSRQDFAPFLHKIFALSDEQLLEGKNWSQWLYRTLVYCKILYQGLDVITIPPHIYNLTEAIEKVNKIVEDRGVKLISSAEELLFQQLLTENNITFRSNYMLHSYFPDIYIPEYKTVMEIDSVYHNIPYTGTFHDVERLKKILFRYFGCLLFELRVGFFVKLRRSNEVGRKALMQKFKKDLEINYNKYLREDATNGESKSKLAMIQGKTTYSTANHIDIDAIFAHIPRIN